MSKLINGKNLADQINIETRKQIIEQGLHPHLAAILVGDDESSKLYVSLKEKACKLVGIEFSRYYLDTETTEAKVLEMIQFLNNDPEIDGMIVQLPLPQHLNTDKIIATIAPEKDADGFGPANLKDFMEFKARIIPPLPNAIYELIKSTGIDFVGKHAVILSNSEIFAMPIVNMMKYKGGTAEYVNPNEMDLTPASARGELRLGRQKTQNADIVVIAVGKKWFLDKSMVKKDSIIIDAGINKENEIVYGDVNPNVDEVASFRSPVPGGVGPMTIAMLLRNVTELHKLRPA